MKHSETDPEKPARFKSDADFLDHAIPWLAARVARLAGEQAVADQLRHDVEAHPMAVGKIKQVSLDEARRRVDALLVAEQSVDAEFTARLKAHRESDEPRLGLDVLRRI